MVADYDLACERLTLLAGLRVLEYSENPQPEIGRRGGMVWIGDNSIELGQPIVEGGGAARFVTRSGGGMHSVAVQVDDLEATMAHMESCGVRIAARPMKEFCFSDPRDTDGVFIEWGEFELEVDPRFGATIPPFATEPILEVVHHAFVGAIVEDPEATAELLCRLLGTSVVFEKANAGKGEPRFGVSLGDCVLALYCMPKGQSLELWGRQYGRARTHLLALSVRDTSRIEQILAEHHFTVLRRCETGIVLDPSTTGHVQVMLVEDLLPGDPRLD